MLTGPCPFHPYKDEHDNVKSGNQLKDCRKFEALLEAYRRISQAATNSGYPIIPGAPAYGVPAAPPLPPPQLASVIQQVEQAPQLTYPQLRQKLPRPVR